jgi:hypothetical protein
MIMLKDLTIMLEDRPGTLADLGEALEKADVNIEGLCGVPCGDQGVMHLLVEDSAKLRSTLEEIGLEVAGEREVLTVELENKPGTLGKAARKIADAGVNIEVVYLAAETKLVVGVDDLEKARSAV